MCVCVSVCVCVYVCVCSWMRVVCVCVCVCVCVWPKIEHSAKHSALSVRHFLLLYYIFNFCIKNVLLYVACVCVCLFCLLDANSNNYLQEKEYEI